MSESASNREFTVRPYGDRWGIAIDGEVILVAATLEDAKAVAATAAEVLAKSRQRRGAEQRSFARSED
jgi:hypothetical protein